MNPAPVVILNVGGGNAGLDGIGPQLQKLLGDFSQVAGLTPKPIGEAIEEMVQAKLRSGLTKTYVTGLRQYLSMFALNRENQPLHTFKVQDLEQWFDARNESAPVRFSNRGRFSALWSFGIRKGYCRENPAERLERVRVVRGTPKIMTARQAMRAVLFALKHNPTFLAWLILGLKAGLRPYECATFPGERDRRRVSWEDINLAEGTIRIESSATKTRQRRVVHLTPDAVEWLKLAKLAESRLPLSMQSKKKLLDRVKRALRWERWQQDVLRHTAASVLLAETQDAAYTSRQLGNSPAILLTNYAAILTKPEAQKYRFMPKPRHWRLAEVIGTAKRMQLNTR